MDFDEIFDSFFFDLFLDPFHAEELEVARFVESKYGNHNLMDKAGHVYVVNHRNKTGEKIYWTCREYKRTQGRKIRHNSVEEKCPARLTTLGIHIIAAKGAHNHPVIEHQLENYDRKYEIENYKEGKYEQE